MSAKQVLTAIDYAIILIFLIISASIGVLVKFLAGKQNTISEYFLANKKAPMLLVISSATVSLLSAVSMIGSPAETYRFGMQIAMISLGNIFGMVLASIIFLPVYFQLKVNSIYEFLEMRFGRITRYVTSMAFIFHMILYSTTVLYAPVLALNAVTNMPLEMGIATCGAVCTFYCLVGGLKAVLWTDLLQIILMVLCMIIIYVVGIFEVGGIGEVYRRAAAGNRLQHFNMQFDFTTRYTFWNMSIRGFFAGIYYFGTNQIQVQRSLSMSNQKSAQWALYWSTMTIAILYLLTCYAGMILYAVFYLCDPVLMVKETGVTKYDQLVPYFIISRLKSFPGLTGLCIAGMFSGSLSTLSSAINSMCTVTVIDLIQPSFGSKLNQKALVLIAKVLSLVFGIIIIGITFTISKVDSIYHICLAFLSLAEGPVLVIFLIGVLTRKTSDKSAAIGLIVGISLIGWVGIGSTFSGYSYASLPLETKNCPTLWNNTELLTNVSTLNTEKQCTAIDNCISSDNSKELFFLYKISAPWFPVIGIVITLITMVAANFCIDDNKNVIPSNSKCLSPVVYYWTPKSTEFKNTNQKEIQQTSQEDNL